MLLFNISFILCFLRQHDNISYAVSFFDMTLKVKNAKYDNFYIVFFIIGNIKFKIFGQEKTYKYIQILWEKTRAKILHFRVIKGQRNIRYHQQENGAGLMGDNMQSNALFTQYFAWEPQGRRNVQRKWINKEMERRKGFFLRGEG